MEFVKYTQEGYVGTITINREKELNALNNQVLDDLNECLDNIDLDTVRCVIITGAGKKSFVAGADIAYMRGLSKEEGAKFAKKGNDVFLKVESFPMPTITAVNGFALGGGCELSMACDMRYAADNALFGQPETGLGITPGFGGTQRLARIVGASKAKEMIFTAKKITAEEALDIGLVDVVVPRESLMEKCNELAHRIAKNAPIAVRASKRAINEGLQVDIEQGAAIEEKMFGSCFETVDVTNAMTAFVEKRKPEPFVNK